ncbi:MAG: hypothetical protein ACR2IJ_02385 [Fluviibacter sp.]
MTVCATASSLAWIALTVAGSAIVNIAVLAYIWQPTRDAKKEPAE